MNNLKLLLIKIVSVLILFAIIFLVYTQLTHAATADLEITQTLKKGSTGSEVKELQIRLQKLGLDIGSNSVDGIFGNKTETSVKAIQKYSNINVDGIVGKSETVPAINKLLKSNSNDQKKKLSNIQNEFLSENKLGGFINPYVMYTYDQMKIDINKLKQTYGSIIQIDSIGSSVEGRDIPLIKLGNGKKKIILNGSHHAREYISTTLLMKMTEVYADLYTKNEMLDGYNVKAILDSTTIYIVPMVNPDGVTICQFGAEKSKNPELLKELNKGSANFSSWKSNIRGVDLNRQYPYGWEKVKSSDNPGSEGYKGKEPATEPEVKALIKLTNENDFLSHTAFHTQGEILYWYDKQAGEFYDKCFDLGNKISSLTGYKLLSKGEQADAYGGYKDWTISKFKKPGFTIELCPYVGNFPYPDKEFDIVWNKAKSTGLLLASEV